MSAQWNVNSPRRGVKVGRTALIATAGVAAMLVTVLVLTTIGMTGGSGQTADDPAPQTQSQEQANSQVEGDYRFVFDDEEDQCLALSEQGDGADRWVMAMRGCEDEPTDFTVTAGEDNVIAIGFANEAWDGQCLAPDGPAANELRDADPTDIWYFAPYECQDDSIPFNFRLKEAGDDIFHLETAAQQCLGVSHDDEFQDGKVVYTVPCGAAKPLRFEKL